MGPSVSLRGASPRQRPVAAGCDGSALERPEGANGRFWADSGRAPVRAPISAHLLAQRKALWKLVQGRNPALHLENLAASVLRTGRLVAWKPAEPRLALRQLAQSNPASAKLR